MHSHDVLHLDPLVSTSQLTRQAEAPLAVTITSALKAEPFTLTAGACIIGSGEGANFVLRDKTVSRRHLSLRLVPEGVHVIDLGSTNGTAYRNHCLLDVVLSVNCMLRLGRTFIELAFAGPSPSDSDVALAAALPGQAPAMQQLYGSLKRLQGSLLPLLLTGESATSKRFVARTIHEHSTWGRRPLVTFDCGASVRTFSDDELFGRRNGTREADSCARAFEHAKGATLFLDQVDALPLDAQASLIRALEERDLVPFNEAHAGGHVRLLAATDRDLAQLVRLGKFRQDLYQRLTTVHLLVPTLRELREDSTPPLAAGELASAGLRVRTGYGRG